MSTHARKIEAVGHSGKRNAEMADLEKSKRSTRDILMQVAASYVDVAMAARQAHWNVRGPGFASMHDTFGEIYSSLDEHADELAERVAALGGVPRGTVQSAAKETLIEPFPVLAKSEWELIDALGARLGQLSALTRRAISEFERLDDPVTVHHLTEAGASVEKHLWIMESHTPSEKI